MVVLITSIVQMDGSGYRAEVLLTVIGRKLQCTVMYYLSFSEHHPTAVYGIAVVAELQ